MHALRMKSMMVKQEIVRRNNGEQIKAIPNSLLAKKICSRI